MPDCLHWSSKSAMNFDYVWFFPHMIFIGRFVLIEWIWNTKLVNENKYLVYPVILRVTPQKAFGEKCILFGKPECLKGILLCVKRQYFFLKELPGTLPEDIMIWWEDPPSSYINQTFSRRRFWALWAMLFSLQRTKKRQVKASVRTQAPPLTQPF